MEISNVQFSLHRYLHYNCQVSIVERSDDGWIIDSIVTLLKDSDGGIQVLTQNLDAHRWVDGDRLPIHRRFELTNA